MSISNVQSSRGVTLVGAGAPAPEDIRLLLSYAPDLVAADGGANACHAQGLSPIAVIGDFDSLAPETRDGLTDTRFIHVEEQDSTDFEKSLTRIAAPFILATGFTGNRIDHALAVMSALVQHKGAPVIVLGGDDIFFAAPKQISLDLPFGTRVSIFPMTRLQGKATGLKWPIDDVVLQPDGRIGTSNMATGHVTLEFDTRGGLIFLPRTVFEIAFNALTTSPSAPKG